MRLRTEQILSDSNVPFTTVAIVFALSVFVFRSVESRWCFYPDNVDRECLDRVKAQKGLNGKAEGGLSSNQTLHDRVILAGCLQVLMREAEAGCVDEGFLGEFYSCVFNYTTDMKEELKKVNLTSLKNAKELGEAFKDCLNGQMVPWTDVFWQKENISDTVGWPFF